MNKLVKLSLTPCKRFHKLSTRPEINAVIKKLAKLPVNSKIDPKYFHLTTLERIANVTDQFLSELINNLQEYGIKDRDLANTLMLYDDWSVLSRTNLSKSIEKFRTLNFLNPDLFPVLFAAEKCVLEQDKEQLKTRVNDLKEFFSKKQLNKIIVNTPCLLSGDLDSIRYKYTYVYIIMGIVDQDEMVLTRMFNYPIEHIRQRHLFLERAALYDRPNKKGQTKIENPRLYHILDLQLKEYLKICTKNVFDSDDYDTFCSYLKEEDFENEMLGNKICRSFRNQIIDTIQISKREKRQLERSQD